MDTVPSVDVLLVTVTDIEARTILGLVKQKFGRVPQARYLDPKTYYDLGTIGGARTWMVRSEMGSDGTGASMATTSKAIEELQPSVVIAVGIAFGVNSDKQKIGDILISDKMCDYGGSRRVGTDSVGRPDIIDRGNRVPPSTRLLDRFREGKLAWEEKQKEPKVEFGPILSGPDLVDNIDYRNSLLKIEPEAIGGEMEGAGLFVAAYDNHVDWIVVKAICDRADGKKGENKSGRQELAARNAACFVLFVLERGGLAGNRILSPSGGIQVILERISKVDAHLQQLGVEQSNAKKLQEKIAELESRLKAEHETIPLDVLIPSPSSHFEAGLALTLLCRLGMEDGYEAQLLHLWQREDMVESLKHDISAETYLFKIGWCLFSIAYAIHEVLGKAEATTVEFERLTEFTESLHTILHSKLEQATLQEVLDFLFMPMIWLSEPLTRTLASINTVKHIEKVTHENDLRSMGLYLDYLFSPNSAEIAEQVIKSTWEHLRSLVTRSNDAEGIAILVHAVWHLGEREARQVLQSCSPPLRPKVAEELINRIRDDDYWEDKDVLRSAVRVFGANDVPRQTDKVLSQLESLDPDDVWVRTIKGRILTELERWSDAEQYVRAALKLQPTYGLALETLAVLLIKCGRMEEAMPSIDLLDTVDPERANSIREWLSGQAG